jgi:ParB family chromosome partitioning protein
MGHARALLSLESRDLMIMVAKKILREGLSVRRVEGLIRVLKSGYYADKSRNLFGDGVKTPDPLQKDLRLKLERALGTRVELRKVELGYAVVIHFSGPEQLNGLLDSLGIEM